jgi:hypothetical protein
MSWLGWALGQSDGPRRDLFGVGGAVQGAAQLGAAGIQSSAINRATDAQRQAAENQLAFQKDIYGTQQQALQPYLAAGQSTLASLDEQRRSGFYGDISPQYAGQIQDVNVAGLERNPDFAAPGGPMAAFSSPVGPTAAFDPSQVNLSQDPGYRFRLDEGAKALQRSQQASGITGGAAAKALVNYNQNAANQEYGAAYNRALQASQRNESINAQNFGQALQGSELNRSINAQNFGQAAQGYGLTSANRQQALQNTLAGQQTNNANVLTRYNMAEAQRQGMFNRQAAEAGIGQAGASQLLSAGTAAAQGAGSAYSQLGNALSAGSAAQGNVWGNAVSGLGNTGSQYLMMRQMGLGQPGGAATRTPPFVDETLYGWE